MDYQKIITLLLQHNITIDIITNLILLIQEKRTFIQLEKNKIPDHTSLHYLVSFLKQYQIEYYIYREDTIINGYTLLYLSKNNHLLDKNKVKEKDYLYIGTLLNLEYSCSNCMELYHNRNQDIPFQIRIMSCYKSDAWTDDGLKEFLADFNLNNVIRGNFFCQMTTHYHLPKTFQLIKYFQTIFYQLKIPIRIHLELDPIPNYWELYNETINYTPIYNSFYTP